MTNEIVALCTHRVEGGVEMGICGGMRGECIIQVGKQFEHILRPLYSLSHFLIWALWKCRKFMQELEQQRQQHLQYREIFDFLIKLLSL